MANKGINAKDEFIRMVGSNIVIAAEVQFGDNSWDPSYPEDKYILYKNYNQKEYDEFLKFLDTDYDNGYGGQNLYGTIWCENGVWLERGEYDGSEWWNLMSYPNNIPTDLKHERRGKIKNIYK